MKKVSIILFLLMLSVAFNGFSQASAPSDFFAGQWETTIQGAPQGDVNIRIDIVRKDGKLTVNLGSENFINSRVQEERATELLILHDVVSNPHMPKESVKARDVHIILTKVDDNTLQVDSMGSNTLFKRVK